MSVAADNFFKQVCKKDSARCYHEAHLGSTVLGVWPRHGGIGRSLPQATPGADTVDDKVAASNLRPPSHHFKHPSDVSPTLMNTVQPQLKPFPLHGGPRPASERPVASCAGRSEIGSADMDRLRGHIRPRAQSREPTTDTTTHRAHFTAPPRALRFAVPEAALGRLRDGVQREILSREHPKPGPVSATTRADFPGMPDKAVLREAQRVMGTIAGQRTSAGTEDLSARLARTSAYITTNRSHFADAPMSARF
mmetsp:Transcript_7977/g.18779  ORF Transcript_7977/g.18779 Transcript_7977/m.18779 type:complete len:251 (-) Transcript_7977:114-866(-)